MNFIEIYNCCFKNSMTIENIPFWGYLFNFGELAHMAKVVQKLNMAAAQEGFFSDVAMIGIGTAHPAYHLCWLVNEHFGIDFVRDPDQSIPMQKKDVQYYFPVYICNLPNSSHRYMLYKLKNGNESLLPETRLLDYLWLIQTDSPEEDALLITGELRNIPGIQLARILEQDQLKSLANLLV